MAPRRDQTPPPTDDPTPDPNRHVRLVYPYALNPAHLGEVQPGQVVPDPHGLLTGPHWEPTDAPTTPAEER